MNHALKSGIEKNLLTYNTILNFIGHAVPLLIGIFVIPFIIQGLGVERFGLLSLAWVVLGYFTIFDLGLSRATTKFAAEIIYKKENHRLQQLFWFSLVFSFFFGVIGSIILAILSPLLVGGFLKIPPHLLEEAKTSFFIIAISVPIITSTNCVRGMLEAGQRFDLVNLVKIPSHSIIIFAPVIGIYYELTLPGIILLLLVSWFITFLIYLLLCFLVFPVSVQAFSLDKRFLRPLFSFGSWITVTNMIAPVIAYTDRFLIGSLLTVNTVAYYTAPYEIVTRLWILPMSMVAALFPAFSAIGAERVEDLSHLYANAIKYLLLTLGPIVLILILFGEDILSIWLGNSFAEKSSPVFQILAVGVLINSLSHIPFSLLQGMGRPDIIAKLYILYLPLNTALVWFLVSNFGISGAAWSFTIRAGIDTFILFVLSFRLTPLSFISFVKRGAGQGISFLFAFGVILWIISLFIKG